MKNKDCASPVQKIVQVSKNNSSPENDIEKTSKREEILDLSTSNECKATKDVNNIDTSISSFFQSLKSFSAEMPENVVKHKLNVCLQAIKDLMDSKQSPEPKNKQKIDNCGVEQSRSFYQKFDKDSNLNSATQNDWDFEEGSNSHKKNKELIWRMFVDPYGYVKSWGPNAKEIFGIHDLIGFNFFDNLMAGYNKSYFTAKFGAYPIANMKWPTTVLRYSRNHQDDETDPVIITSKLTLVYSSPKSGFPRVIIGAKIFSRLSSDSSTAQFRNKLKIGTAKAGQIAIKHMKFQMYLRQNVSLALQNIQQNVDNLDQTQPDICAFHPSWLFL